MTHVFFVSVNKSFTDTMTLAGLEPWVERAWATTVAKVAQCDRVVAVHNSSPVGAWEIRAAFPTSELWDTGNGTMKPRVGLSLGATLPILAEYIGRGTGLRHGCGVEDVPVSPIPQMRQYP